MMSNNDKPEPIEWDEPRKPHRARLLVTQPGQPIFGMTTRPATIEDLRRACEAVGLKVQDEGAIEMTLTGTAAWLSGDHKHTCPVGDCPGRTQDSEGEPIGISNSEIVQKIHEWGIALVAQSIPIQLGDLFRLEAKDIRVCSDCQAKRCAELILSAPECKDACDFVKDAIELASVMKR